MKLLEAPSSLTLNASDDGASLLLRRSSALAVGGGILSRGAGLQATSVRADGVCQSFPTSEETPSGFRLVGRSPRPTWQPELRFLRTSAKPALLPDLGAQIGASLGP